MGPSSAPPDPTAGGRGRFAARSPRIPPLSAFGIDFRPLGLSPATPALPAPISTYAHNATARERDLSDCW